eukprot:7376004-Prymnesium_polylepis.1
MIQHDNPSVPRVGLQSLGGALQAWYIVPQSGLYSPLPPAYPYAKPCRGGVGSGVSALGRWETGCLCVRGGGRVLICTSSTWYLVHVIPRPRGVSFGTTHDLAGGVRFGKKRKSHVL